MAIKINSKNRRKYLRENMMIWMIFVPFLLISVALLYFGISKVVQHLASQSWQPVQATLLERDVAVQKNPDGSDSIGGAARFTGKFTYQWEGKSYQSDQVTFSSSMTRSMGSTPDDWDDRVDEYLGEPGNKFTAWLNPANPASAVAIRDLRWLEIGAMFGFGLILLWISYIFLFGDNPHNAEAAFSWRTVGTMWVVGMLLAPLAPLLWRDGHPVWAVIVALPVLLAIYGTVHGLRLK